MLNLNRASILLSLCHDWVTGIFYSLNTSIDNAMQIGSKET